MMLVLCLISRIECIKMAVLSKIKSHLSVVVYLKEVLFYNKPIKKPKVKLLKNIDQLAERPFYE